MCRLYVGREQVLLREEEESSSSNSSKESSHKTRKKSQKHRKWICSAMWNIEYNSDTEVIRKERHAIKRKTSIPHLYLLKIVWHKIWFKKCKIKSWMSIRILRFWLKYFKFFTMMENLWNTLNREGSFPGGAKNPACQCRV